MFFLSVLRIIRDFPFDHLLTTTVSTFDNCTAPLDLHNTPRREAMAKVRTPASQATAVGGRPGRRVGSSRTATQDRSRMERNSQNSWSSFFSYRATGWLRWSRHPLGLAGVSRIIFGQRPPPPFRASLWQIAGYSSTSLARCAGHPAVAETGRLLPSLLSDGFPQSGQYQQINHLLGLGCRCGGTGDRARRRQVRERWDRCRSRGR